MLKSFKPIMPMHHRRFTLIEMANVILIFGMIAAVAAPKMFDTAKTAEQNSSHQQLAILRNAIKTDRATEGVYPIANALPACSAPLLNGPFPKPMIGSIREKQRYITT